MDALIPRSGLLSGLETRLQKAKWDVWLVTGIAALMAFLLYDFKVSEGGDDSAYVSRAYDLLKIGKFPSFQGPVYPVFLSILIALFGMKLQILKISSAIFMVLFFHFGYKLLKNRMPAVALLPTFVIAAVSPMLMYFASQTYSEAFFLFLMVGFLYSFLPSFVDEGAEPKWKDFLLSALWLWLLGSTRTVGYAALPAAMLFLALDKKWIDIAKLTASFGGVFLGMQALKTAIFGGDFLQFSSQGGTLLLKDPYTPTNGKEDLSGFVDRFIGNADLYLSKHYMKFLGFRNDTIYPNGNFESLQVDSTYTIMAVLLFGGAVYLGWKNKTFRFLAILTTGFITLTFLAVQTRWDQARLIIPYLPFYTLIVLAGFVYLFGRIKGGLNAGQIVYVSISAIVILSIISKGSDVISESQEEFKEAMAGNMLAGYTPDWQSYIRMSEYAAEYVPEEEGIAARKAGISFIYGERKFVGVTKIPFFSMDDLDTEKQRILIRSQQLQKCFNLTGLSLNSTDLLVFGEPKQGSQLKSEQFYYSLELPQGQEESIIAIMDSAGVKYWSGLTTLTDEFKETYLIDPDGLVDWLEERNVNYIIMGTLRRNPKQRSEFIINTIQRYLYYIQAKYPDAFQQIHQIGQESLEPASLIKINYDNINAQRARN